MTICISADLYINDSFWKTDDFMLADQDSQDRLSYPVGKSWFIFIKIPLSMKGAAPVRKGIMTKNVYTFTHISKFPHWITNPEPYKFKIGDRVMMDPKNKHVPGWKDCGVGEVVEQSRLYRNEAFNPVYDKKENCYGIVWEGLSGPTYSFEDNLMPAPEQTVEKQWKLADDPIMLSDEVVKFIKAEVKDELDRRGFENSEY